MIKTLVYRLLRHHHFWREVGFDELSELYISMMFRGMAISLVGLFVPLYLLGLDFSVADIIMVMAWYFTVRALFFDFIAGHTVARIGPKHSMVISYLLLVGSTTLFLTLPSFGWPLWLLGGLWGGAQSFFFIAFNVDFSKVKHSEHGGKELGYIIMMEKTGAVLGPLVGGFVATYFGPRYIFIIGIALLIFGLVPLFRTAEPVKLRQRLDFKGFKVRKHRRVFMSFVGVGIENNISVFVWPLFLGVFILTDASAYAKLGVLTAVSFIVSIIASKAIGQTIDDRKGRVLLRYSAVANSLIHLVRPFVSTYPVAFGLNIINDIVTPGYRIPFFKGLFDSADEVPGYRIVYITSLEAFGSLVKAAICWFLVVLAFNLSAYATLTIGFGMAAVVSLLIMTERFKALDPKPIIKGEHA